MLDQDFFAAHGYLVTSPLLSAREITDVIALIDNEAQRAERRRGGMRDIMTRIPQLGAIANHPAVRAIVDELLGPGAFVVRSTFFDKTGDANWKVPWHQDVTIAVRQRRDTQGYGPWSIKQEIVHVQPPSAVLENMVTVRVHLDACPSINGALRVMPGSHWLGRIDQNAAAKYVNETAAVTCEAAAGEALVMRPLLLHASSASESPGHRRVLHFDFANEALPEGLEWKLR